MPPAWVVPTLDPGKDRQARLGLGLPATPGNELALQTGKEALCHGVVIGISNRSHRGAHPHLLASVAKRNAGVPATLVRVVNHRLGLSGHQGHVERQNHQVSGQVWSFSSDTAVHSTRFQIKPLSG